MTKKENRLKQIDEMLELENNRPHDFSSCVTGGEVRGEANATELLTRKIVLPDQLIVQGIISAVKGISDTMSTMLIDNDITLSHLILGTHTYTDIAGIRYPGGKAIQVNQAKKIIKKYTDIASLNIANASPEQEKNMIKMLAAVPGVSQKTAKVILKEITIRELIVDTNCTDSDNDIEKKALMQLRKRSAVKQGSKTKESKIAKIMMTKRRKVGPVMAAKLIYFFNYNKEECS